MSLRLTQPLALYPPIQTRQFVLPLPIKIKLIFSHACKALCNIFVDCCFLLAEGVFFFSRAVSRCTLSSFSPQTLLNKTFLLFSPISNNTIYKMSKLVVYGGAGALGRSLVQHFKTKGYVK